MLKYCFQILIIGNRTPQGCSDFNRSFGRDNPVVYSELNLEQGRRPRGSIFGRARYLGRADYLEKLTAT